MNTKLAPMGTPGHSRSGALLLAAYRSTLCRSENLTSRLTRLAEEAGHALFLAVQNHDERTVGEILQSRTPHHSARMKISRTDSTANGFAQKYREMHRFTRAGPDGGNGSLQSALRNWPFPDSRSCHGNGAWRFDSDAGARTRSGTGESGGEKRNLPRFALCQALVAHSHPGRGRVRPMAPTAAVLRRGKRAGGPARLRFHGYYFRTLMGSGNSVAALAYPVAYRSSGLS